MRQIVAYFLAMLTTITCVFSVVMYLNGPIGIHSAFWIPVFFVSYFVAPCFIGLATTQDGEHFGLKEYGEVFGIWLVITSVFVAVLSGVYFFAALNFPQ
jgi:hypothetical protein